MFDLQVEWNKRLLTIKKQYPEGTMEKLVSARLFNVHKRSLPIGLDEIVLFRVKKAEAEWWIEKILHTKCYQNDTNESKTIIYYDVLPVDATPKERSIFSNLKEIML